MIGRPLHDQPTDNPPARVFLKTAADLDRLRTACAQIVADFRNPRLSLINLPEVSELTIEFEGCHRELPLVVMALVASGIPAGTKVRLGKSCPLCSDPSACREAKEDLLRTCHPSLQALIYESLDIITDLGEGS